MMTVSYSIRSCTLCLRSQQLQYHASEHPCDRPIRRFNHDPLAGASRGLQLDSSYEIGQQLVVYL